MFEQRHKLPDTKVKTRYKLRMNHNCARSPCTIINCKLSRSFPHRLFQTLGREFMRRHQSSSRETTHGQCWDPSRFVNVFTTPLYISRDNETISLINLTFVLYVIWDQIKGIFFSLVVFLFFLLLQKELKFIFQRRS